MGGLTALKVRTLTEPGMYCDGQGLYLCVGKGSAKSWILRTTVFGRRREIGLGSAHLVSLAEARDEARRLRKVARGGGDPLAHRNREAITFEQAAERVFEANRATWKNKKHTDTWLSSIQSYAVRHLKERPLDQISTRDVLNVLEPIWIEKHETARRLKQRLSTIFDWAKGAGYYPHENPVNGVTKALPVVKRRAKHMRAMSWRELPSFIAKLKTRSGVSANTLLFVILTATRSGEARGARWSEFDMGKRIWTIPAERMKAGKAHRVPLTDQMIAILNRQRGLDPEFVFPSNQRGKDGRARVQSDMVFTSLYKRMGESGFTTHGFRSTFRDWCSEATSVSSEVAEIALAHFAGNQVERAYARSDLFEKRINLMRQWSDYAMGASSPVTRKLKRPVKVTQVK
ncbi:site-specific integrase [Pararhodobacter sp. SW119]|uniref:tyrosine-type recombinase/integrase n=1 Tax=Pararhodobacter sp. SW119 TaxID=2780075 RepID=UPI001ADFEFDE|nr:site-specific integrase [Pararhodobacter sp. SW119]